MRTRLKWVFGVGFALATALGMSGCGSSSTGGTPDPSCRLIATLSGSVNFTFGEGSVSCLTVNAPTSELLALFDPKSNADVKGMGIAVLGFVPGQTGAGYSATLNISHTDGRTFYALACTVDLSENTSLGATTGGTKYRVSGQGRCTAPATAAGGSIDVSPFEFTTEARR